MGWYRSPSPYFLTTIVMIEIVKRKIDTKIYRIVWNDDLSFNKKAKLIHKFLSKYENMYWWEGLSFNTPNIYQVNNMIYSCMQKKEAERHTAFDKYSYDIANIIVDKQIDKWL